MLSIKTGVRLHGLKPEALLAIMVVNEIYQQSGHKAVLISVVDGDHDGGPFSTSSHYGGMAFDVQRPMGDPTELVNTIKAALGEEFHVTINKTHIHVAYMPQSPRGR